MGVSVIFLERSRVFGLAIENTVLPSLFLPVCSWLPDVAPGIAQSPLFSSLSGLGASSNRDSIVLEMNGESDTQPGCVSN